MKNADPRVTAARKLAVLADELERGASFPVTRLTVLKRLCGEWESAATFVCCVADLSRARFRTAPPARLEAERVHQFGTRIGAAMECIRDYMAVPTRDTELALRAARRDLESAQNATRDTRWATVRTIDCRDALVVEKAIHCILDPPDCAAWGYQVGRAYAERYDPRHGGGLVPESAPLVRDIAEFWLRAPQAPLTAGWRSQA